MGVELLAELDVVRAERDQFERTALALADSLAMATEPKELGHGD